jgi:hypothetical protein
MLYTGRFIQKEICEQTVFMNNVMGRLAAACCGTVSCFVPKLSLANT